MEDRTAESRMATKCRIRVKGRLTEDWSERMHGLSITTLIGQDTVETTLEGDVPDQSALQGVIASLGDLNLAVISVEALDDEGTANLPNSRHPGIGAGG
jgi:hypothetical protein